MKIKISNLHNIIKRYRNLILEKMLPASVYNKLKKQRNKKVKFGDLRRLTPISRQFGYDRGVPIDRFYIERFIDIHAQDVCGHVLEIKDSTYTKMFGGAKVTHCDVLHNIEGNAEATILGDLTKADHIQSETFDCIILTQTLHIIYDIRAALSNLYRVLKTGGVLLATFPGISQVVKGVGDNDYNWAFTIQSAQLLFEEYFGRSNIYVESHGNVLAAIAFLHGIAQEELTKEELLYQDDEYQVVITVRAIKKA